MIKRRTILKWLHWLSFFLILYFFLVEPDENKSDPGGALSTHAGAGLILSLVTAIWLAMFVRKGLVGRPGPKLPGWAKRVHILKHRILQYGVPIMVGTGAFTGLAAPFAIKAFGALQINPGVGAKWLHGFAEEVHELVFNVLLFVIVAHVIFHLWRHFLLKDNALRIMVPKALHKYL